MPRVIDIIGVVCVLVLFALIVALPLCISARRADEALREAERYTEDGEGGDAARG